MTTQDTISKAQKKNLGLVAARAVFVDLRFTYTATVGRQVCTCLKAVSRFKTACAQTRQYFKEHWKLPHGGNTRCCSLDKLFHAGDHTAATDAGSSLGGHCFPVP